MNPFNMFFMLNIDELIIIHINLNDQINKYVIRTFRVISYPVMLYIYLLIELYLNFG